MRVGEGGGGEDPADGADAFRLHPLQLLHTSHTSRMYIKDTIHDSHTPRARVRMHAHAYACTPTRTHARPRTTHNANALLKYITHLHL